MFHGAGSRCTMHVRSQDIGARLTTNNGMIEALLPVSLNTIQIHERQTLYIVTESETPPHPSKRPFAFNACISDSNSSNVSSIHSI